MDFFSAFSFPTQRRSPADDSAGDWQVECILCTEKEPRLSSPEAARPGDFSGNMDFNGEIGASIARETEKPKKIFKKNPP